MEKKGWSEHNEHKHEHEEEKIFHCHCGAVLEKVQPNAPTVLKCPKCGREAVIDVKGWLYFI